jgi:hypothetical protein
MNDEKETMDGIYCGWGGRKWFFIPMVVIAGIFIFGAIVMCLWNAVMPHVFTSVGPVTYCQAIGILVLSKILFGGFSKGGRGFAGRRARSRECKEKWMNMSEEERAKFKEEWKNRCC